MSSSTVFTTAILATLLFVSSTMGHSQMRCAKYNTQTKECLAPIRNAGQSWLEEANDISTGKPICQSPWTNPITASYDGSASCGWPGCPGAMGTYTPGEVFTVMWPARNHAVADQTPGNITLYLSPAETVNQGKDVTADVFQLNKFCTAPYMSCNGQNGDLVPCTATCTMPSGTQAGLYTLWWKWVWPGHTSVYSTCADIMVIGGSTPSKPQQSTTGAQAPAVPSTTGSKPVAPAQPSTTGASPAAVPSTTGRAAAPVTPTPTPIPTPTPTPSTCTAGHMKCLTSETYSMCNMGAWGPSQSCAFETQCSPSGDYIYCIRPSKPTTPVPVPSTPSTSTSSSSSDSSCTMGNQRCTGSNSYQTCGNGVNGPAWSANQFCQAGLSCYESSTSKNIYCY